MGANPIALGQVRELKEGNFAGHQLAASNAVLMSP